VRAGFYFLLTKELCNLLVNSGKILRVLHLYKSIAGAAESFRNQFVNRPMASFNAGFAAGAFANRPNLLLAVADGPNRSAGTSGSPTQLPPDVGLCAKCEAKNSKHASRCHACGEVLPWSKEARVAAKPKAPIAPAFNPGPAGALPPVDRGVQIHNAAVTAGEWAVIGGLGMVFFLIGLGGGLIAALLYRYLNNTESKFANWVLAGVLTHVLLLVTRLFFIGHH
jgi:ribosomal protein L40E